MCRYRFVQACGGACQRSLGVYGGMEERSQAADGPERRPGPSRLGIERRFARRAGMGIGDVDRQCAGIEQRVRPALGGIGGSVEAKRL